MKNNNSISGRDQGNTKFQAGAQSAVIEESAKPEAAIQKNLKGIGCDF